ncbi:outer membrane protein [Escherichia coli]|uniref:Outer membrane protein n=1 Tax=Escherichia coli TaxID=562 RepID=A0A376YFX8_ECOLX|nr:outer membrane protein [Escherichia coli]
MALRKLGSPSTWKEGVAGVLMDYNLFASNYRPQDGSSSTNLNAYGTTGINAGSWRLRSDYQLNTPIAKIAMNSQAEYRAPIFFVHYRN